jgi:hypothetical protein
METWNTSSSRAAAEEEERLETPPVVVAQEVIVAPFPVNCLGLARQQSLLLLLRRERSR